MNKDWIMALTLLLGAGCGSSISQEAAALPNPPPPFASKQTTQGVLEIGAFDGMVNVGGCGSKAQKQFGVVCGANKLFLEPGGRACA